MKMFAYAVRDNAVGVFLPPLFARSKGEAFRNFQTAVSTPEHQFAKFKKDYALYHLGFFDDEAGRFEPLPQPTQLITALEFDAPEIDRKLDQLTLNS